MDELNTPNVKIIENAALDDVRPGDHLTWERVTTIDGVTITTRYEGIAHHRDEDGDWWTTSFRKNAKYYVSKPIITTKKVIRNGRI